jgi:replicative DNA helicase
LEISHTILENLLLDENFSRKVIPFLKAEYFQDPQERLVFGLLQKFIQKYNKTPTKESLLIDLGNRDNIGQKELERAVSLIESFDKRDVVEQWLLDNTEVFVQNSAIYNAIQKSISIYDNHKKGTGKASLGSIPAILHDALSVSFDSHIGHDYLEDYKARFEYYHRVEHKVPFKLDWLNKVTGGGVSQKTFSVFSGGPGGGKTMLMCDCAAFNLVYGKDVLYLSLEMSEEEISRRVDCNLLNIPISDLELVPWSSYENSIIKVREQAHGGRLIVREFPPTSASADTFRYTLNELFLKQEFKPDIIYIDYMNICASARMKPSSSAFHLYVRAISEELRGLGVEFNVPVITGSQYNKEGYQSSDPGLEDNADSFSAAFSPDFTCAIIHTEDLRQLGQCVLKQTGKNRFRSNNKFTRCVVGYDETHMRYYNLEADQQNIVDFEPRKKDHSTPAKFDMSLFKEFKA